MSGNAAADGNAEVREVRERVLQAYLPAWCASPSRPNALDPSAFITPDWSFLTPELAHWFLTAVDDQVVEVTAGADFKLGSSKSDGLFDHGPKVTSPRPMKLRRESFFEIAAVGMLALRFGWPAERLRFQSEGQAFDFLAYAEDARRKVAIAGEAKRLQQEAVALSVSLSVCGARGDHAEQGCCEPANFHRKYVGLLRHRPGVLWIVGPEAFTSDPDLIFRVEQRVGRIFRLDRTTEHDLGFPGADQRSARAPG